MEIRLSERRHSITLSEGFERSAAASRMPAVPRSHLTVPTGLPLRHRTRKGDSGALLFREAEASTGRFVSDG